MNASQNRMPLIDGVKAIAMQIIVLHHFVSYGPLADAAHAVLPDVVGWLYDNGRIAVQVFLVIGGYLAAKKLSPQGRPFTGSVALVVVQRYLRLAPPFAVALLLAVACAALARQWLPNDDFIPAAPKLGQWLAHLLLLQDLLDYESLSAGVWYVAIDFQLFVLLALSLRLIDLLRGREPWLVCTTVLALCAVSMYWINLDDRFDRWALYFFAAYGLGAAAYWARRGERTAVSCQRALWILTLAALMTDFRWRLLLALATAMLLYWSNRITVPQLPRALSWLARTSYALFLVHFPVFMGVSALFVATGGVAQRGGLIAMAAAWALSLCIAQLMHRYVEAPVSTRRAVPLPVGGRVNVPPGNR